MGLAPAEWGEGESLAVTTEERRFVQFERVVKRVQRGDTGCESGGKGGMGAQETDPVLQEAHSPQEPEAPRDFAGLVRGRVHKPAFRSAVSSGVDHCDRTVPEACRERVTACLREGLKFILLFFNPRSLVANRLILRSVVRNRAPFGFQLEHVVPIAGNLKVKSGRCPTPILLLDWLPVGLG